MLDQTSEAQNDQIKNGSMASTQMTKNQSTPIGFFNAKERDKAILSYAQIPSPKQTPKWNQSASTWRHTSHRYSFTKCENRFPTKQLYYSDLLQPELPSTLQEKTCTFGFGTRKPISEVVLRNAKEKPAPDAYEKQQFDEEPRSPKKGKSFGIGWSNYEKVYIEHRKDVYSGHFIKDNPPAKYEVREKFGKDKRFFSTYGRLKMYTQKMSEVTKGNPGPIYKVKERHLHPNVGMNERNFGFGHRRNLSAPANDYPEAIYDIKGFCEKFGKTKKKNLPKKHV